jgi:hypothetical protein
MPSHSLLLGCLAIGAAFAVSASPRSEAAGNPAQPQVSGGGPNDFSEFCKSAPCRKDVHVRLKKRDGTLFDQQQDLAPPVIQGPWITIYAGEKILIEADEGAEGPTNFRNVAQNLQPQKTITFELSQTGDSQGHSLMVLRVENPFPRSIRYRLGIMALEDKEERVRGTSTCPVRQHGTSFESWPYPIYQAVVAEIRFEPSGKEPVCAE